jgi:copper chaperone CopZ
VKGSVSRLAGVSAVEVSLQGKRATVSFDPQRTSLEAIRAAIEQEGYSVSG